MPAIRSTPRGPGRALPLEHGNALSYANRTSIDPFLGFMQALRHEMGRGMMYDERIESFQAIRAQLAGG